MRIRYVLLMVPALLSGGCRSSILDDPSTTIVFSIAEQSHVQLTVENSYNTPVATLVDTILDAGTHSVSFTADALQEGIYFYTLEARSTSGNSAYMSERHLLLIK